MKKISLVLSLVTICITVRGEHWIKCSEKWCSLDQTKCQQMDLMCKCKKDGFIYCNNSTRPFQMTFNELEGKMNITGRCDENFPVQQLLRLWNAPLTSFKIEKALIIVDNVNRETDKIEGVIDLNSFPQMRSVVSLYLVDRCVENVIGNVTDIFPNVENIKILVRNMKKVPENMKMIPKLKKLDLSSNDLEVITSDDFRGLPSLKDIQLTRNNIHTLPDDFLQENSDISWIRLSINKLKSVPKNLLQNKYKMERLELHQNQLEKLPDDLLQGIKKLKILSLSENKIKTFAPDFFKPQIDTLSLYDNLLTEIPKVNSVIKMDLSRNLISQLNLPLSDVVPSVETLILSENCIKNVSEISKNVQNGRKISNFECSKCCFQSFPVQLSKEVMSLKLSYNDITKLELSELQETCLEDVIHMDLSFNRIRGLDTAVYQFIQQNPIFELSGNNMIKLRGNPFVCDCHFNELLKNSFVKSFMNKFFDMEFWQCKYPNSETEVFVRDLDVNNLLCKMTENCPEKCTCSVNNAMENFLVDCSGLELNEFPTNFSNKLNLLLNFDNNNIRHLPPKTWPMWNKIKELNISQNKLESVANLKVSPIMTKVWLRSNYLTNIEQPIFDMFTDKMVAITVALGRNPWQCSCEMKQLRDLVVKSNDEFYDRQDTVCVLNTGTKAQTYNFYDIDKFCVELRNETNMASTIVIAFVSVFIIIILVLLILFIRFKLEIKFFLFSKGCCLRFVSEEDVDADKLFDAFISYSGEDGDWVRDVLVDGLENGQPSYKLCLHERDWTGGQFIPEQIVRSVQESRRTIIVLTEGFLSSAWSQIEFNVAYLKAAEDGVRRLIVVVPTEMPKLDKARDDLRAFLSTTTYLEAMKPHFWRKLRCSMPRIVSPTHV